ncbi:MAG TPA: exo-alpha-sialidase, partial [Verrucomicrobiae bacterium]|nr:exo-alpha-sialidase [Verrucomicrobiae bacterium]
MSTRLLALLLGGCFALAAADFSTVPGTIITHQPASTGIFLGSPGLAVLPDGTYLAKCDEFGPQSTETS